MKGKQLVRTTPSGVEIQLYVYTRLLVDTHSCFTKPFAITLSIEQRPIETQNPVLYNRNCTRNLTSERKTENNIFLRQLLCRDKCTSVLALIAALGYRSVDQCPQSVRSLFNTFENQVERRKCRMFPSI